MINPKRWVMFIKGFILSHLISIEYCEQVIERAERCSDCVNRGYCDECGCTMPDALFVREFECSKGNFSEMDSDEVHNYKKNHV